MLRRTLKLAVGLVRRDKAEQALSEELRSTVDILTEEQVQRGLSPAEARRQALIELGGIEQVKEAVREARAGATLEVIWQDVKYGLRLMRRTPGLSAAILLTLAIGIGANTAIFSVTNALLIEPLPFPDPDRLVILYNVYTKAIGGAGRGRNAVIDYLERKELTQVFESLALLAQERYNVGAETGPQRVDGYRVTPSMFDVLRVPPAVGRPFTETDAQAGNDRVVILGNGLWKQMFGGSPAVIGRDLRIDGLDYAIVGVMPEAFEVLSRNPQVLLPFAFTDAQRQTRHVNVGDMIGRLQPDASIPLARTQIDALNARVLEPQPQLRDWTERMGFATEVNGLHDEMVVAIRPALYLLQAGVAFVLLIGCVNIANLLLIRSNGRIGELMIRSALGAGRARIVRQLLIEGLSFGFLGALLGLALGRACLSLLTRFGLDRVADVKDVHMGVNVLLFTAVTAVATGLIFGSIPALQLSERDLNKMLRLVGRGSLPGRQASLTRSVLVVAEVSLAVVLLVGAGLLLASFVNALSVDPGFHPQQVLTARLTLPAVRYGREREIGAFVSRVEEALEALPGASGVGITTLLPFSEDMNRSTVTVEGRQLGPGEPSPTPYNYYVSGGYFRAIGVPLIRGRVFDRRDGMDGAPVAVVDTEFADRHWPGENPVEKRIQRGSGGRGPIWQTVIGVVGSVKVRSLTEAAGSGAVYFCQTQPTASSSLALRRTMSLVVKADTAPAQLSDSVRAKLREIDADLPLDAIMTMDTRLADSLTGRRTPTTLLLVFAGMGLLLSSIGVYGVIAHAVSQRTREIGIRMALGAQPSIILKRVMQQGSMLVLAGTGVGLGVSFWATRLMSSMLYGVKPIDSAVFTLSSAVVILVGLTACLLPANRATRINVVAALRDE